MRLFKGIEADNTRAYGQLNDEAQEVTQNLLSSSERVYQHEKQDQAYTRSQKYLYLIYVNVALFLGSCGCLIATLCLLRTSPTYASQRNRLLKQTSFYSPVLDELDISMSTVTFNNTLFVQDSPSIYRGFPSPEVDAAWSAISDLRPITVSKEDIEKIGKDSSKTVKVPDSWGLGSKNHLAYVEVFHKIHCVDTLRRAAHYDYYYRDRYGPEGPTNAYWAHISHCSYLLLQTLMCHADVDLFTYNWVGGQTHPYPDFVANHQCRDFDSIIKWTKERQMDVEHMLKFVKPDDVIEEPEPSFPGSADWAIEKAHREFSSGYKKPTES